MIPICFIQHRNHCDMEMNTEATKQKSQNTFKNKNKIKNIQSKTTQISKIRSKHYSRVARANTFTVCLVIPKYDYVIPSNKKRDKRVFVSYKKCHQNQKNAFTPKQQKIDTSHVYTWFASTSKIAIWFAISKITISNICMISSLVPESPTESMKNKKQRLQAVLSLIKLKYNYKNCNNQNWKAFLVIEKNNLMSKQ